MRRRNSLLLRFPLLFVSALSLFSGPVEAETTRVTGATDYWFTYEEPTTFSVRTYAVQGFGSDPMLWLYNSDGQLLAQNDDWYGLQSHIQIQIPAGTYRLRAGVCCGNPDAWWQGVQYDLDASGFSFTPTTTTTSSTSTTILDTTTTTTSTTTTVEPTTTSTTLVVIPPVSSTVVPDTTSVSTTTVQETTTTTVQETTTTWATTTTSVLTPIATVDTTTTTVAPTTTAETTTTASSAPLNNITTLVTQERSNDSATTTTTSVPVVTRTTAEATTTTTEPLPPVRPVATTIEQVTTTTTITPSEPQNASEQASQAIQELVSNKELTVEALTAVLDDIQVSELNEEQEEQLVAVLNVANEEVKKAFESEVNVYAEGLDEYVPSGSQVPVKTRRVLIATAGLFMSMPTVAVSASKTEVRRKQ